MFRAVVFAVFLQLAYCVSQPDEIVQPPPGKRNRFRLLQYSSNEDGSKDGDSLKISLFFFSVLMRLRIRQTNRDIPVYSVDYPELRFFFSFSCVFKTAILLY